MKKSIALFVFLFASKSIWGQVQNGLVREQNSGKKPLANVQVIFADAVPATSDKSGKFRLVFSNKKAGDLIFYQEIAKKGFELVNEKELQVLKIGNTTDLSKDIVLAKAGTLNNARKEYYAISDKALEAGFKKEEAALKKKFQVSILTQQEYLDKYATLFDQYEQQKKELDALSDVFARTNFDDVSDAYKRAFDFFKAGKVDEALIILEKTKLLSRTTKRLKERKRIETAQTTIAQQKIQNEKDIREDLQGLQLQAQLYVLTFQIDKAENLYDQVLLLDSTDLQIVSSIVQFYKDNHRYEKALHILPTILAHPSAEDWQKAAANADIGLMNYQIGKLNEAFKYCQTSEAAYLRLLETTPNSAQFKFGLAISNRCLGLFYSDLGNYEKSLFHSGRYNQLMQELSTPNPKNNEFATELSHSCSDLASLYNKMGDKDQTLRYYEAAQQIGKELHDSNPQNINFARELAMSYNNLSTSYSNRGDLEKGLYFVQLSNQLELKLFQTASQNVLVKSGLAITYGQLAWVYNAKGQLDTSLTFMEKENALRKELCQSYPQNVAFKNLLAISFSNIGVTYEQLGHLDKSLPFAEQYNKLEYEIHEMLSQNVEYESRLAASYAQLGNTYASMGQLEKALPFFKQQNNLLRELLDAAPKKIEIKNNLAASYARIGQILTSLTRLDTALIFFQQFNILMQEIYNSAPQNEFYKNGFAASYYSLGYTYSSLGDFKKSMACFKENFKLEKELSETHPENLEFSIGLTYSFEGLGYVYQSLRHLDTALMYFDQQTKLLERHHNANPSDLTLKTRLAVSYDVLGNTYATLGNLDKALSAYEAYQKQSKEVYELYPNNVDYKINLAFSYAKLGYHKWAIQQDNQTARTYFSTAQALWTEALAVVPDNIRVQQALTRVRQDLAQLDVPVDPVFVLQNRIQGELDTLAKYQILGILCDSLRQRVQYNAQQKTALADALNFRAWLGLFLQKFSAVEKDVREALALGTENKILHTNLPPALLFQGKVEAAMDEYKKWKDQPYDMPNMPKYLDVFLDDLKTFEAAGVIPKERMPDVVAVRNMLLGKH